MKEGQNELDDLTSVVRTAKEQSRQRQEVPRGVELWRLFQRQELGPLQRTEQPTEAAFTDKNLQVDLRPQQHD